MLIARNLSLCLILGSVVLPRSSTEEKAEDCVKGKQYWSKSFLNPKGTCAPCPPHWKSCYNEPINDQKRCVDSCHVSAKQTPKIELDKITSTTASPSPTPPSTTSTPTSDRDINTSSMTEVYPTLANLTLANPNKAEVNENTKPGHGGEEKGPGTVIAISAFTIAFVALMTVLVLLLVRRNRSTLAPEVAVTLSGLQSADQGEEERRSSHSQIDVLPVQATSSNSALWVGGIQDTEHDKEASSLSLLKESYV